MVTAARWVIPGGASGHPSPESPRPTVVEQGAAPMIPLVISVLFAAAYSHVMRHGQEGKCSMVWVGGISYAVACAVTMATWVFLPGTELGWQELVFGVIGGVAWLAAYLLLSASIRLAGVTIAQCVGWLGVAVPVAASVLLWREIPNTSQYVGLGLMVMALFLLAPGKTSNVTRRSKWKVPALLGLFAAEGVVNVAMKAFTETASEARTPGLLVFMFAVAGLGNLVLAGRQGRSASRSDVGHGVVLGLVAATANYALVVAIGRLAGPVVFPAFWAGTILVTSVGAMALWRERYNLRAIGGMTMALLTMVFISVDVVALLRGLK